jgi:hypothetical protein
MVRRHTKSQRDQLLMQGVAPPEPSSSVFSAPGTGVSTEPPYKHDGGELEMSVAVLCPHCGKKLVANERIAGREVGCPGCKGRLVIPASAHPETVLPAIPIQQPAENPLAFLDSATPTQTSAIPPPLPISASQNPAAAVVPPAKFNWRKIAGIFVAVLMILGGAARGCHQAGGEAQKGESVSVADFVDKTQKFKGYSIEFEMLYNGGKPLRQQSGTVTRFYLSDSDASGLINIDIPSSLDLPNALDGNSVVVIFDCNEGRLDSGNIATEIKRP